jgi:hypothetical protein
VGGGLVAGIVIGLIVGVAVAVGLAMYLNRSATPFSNLEKLDRKAGSTASSAPSTELLEPGTKIADVQANQPAPAASAPVKVEQPAPPPCLQSSRRQQAPSCGKLQEQTGCAPAATAKDEQRFDFYKILPGQVDAVPADGKAAVKTGNLLLQHQPKRSTCNWAPFRMKMRRITSRPSLPC